MGEPEAQAPSKMIRLKSSDGQVFEVSEDVAFKSGTLRDMVLNVEAETASKVIPLSNVTSSVLAKVLEFCKYHVGKAKEKEAKKASSVDLDEDEDDDSLSDGFESFGEVKKAEKGESEVTKWNKEFVDVDQEEFFNLLMASNYLDVKDLTELLTDTVARQIVACKNAEEIRAKFNIPEDFSPAEVAEIKTKHSWAFSSDS